MVGLPKDNQAPQCTSQHVAWLQTALQNSYEFAHENLKSAASRQKNNYENRLKPRSFEIGDFVWRWYPPAVVNKLGQGWTGPYLVIRKTSEVNYEIQKDETSRTIVVHVDHLKPYEGRKTLHNWLNDEPSLLLSDSESDLENEIENSENYENSSPLTSPKRTRRGRIIKPRQIYSP